MIHAESGNSSRRANWDFEALSRAYRQNNQNNPAAVSDETLRQHFFLLSLVNNAVKPIKLSIFLENIMSRDNQFSAYGTMSYLT
ncbi:hypothetical protein DXZ20_18280 [Leptolyngbyaceae cyanobacterium CCMR0081]|uniref:Uncharacterized protein n=1 Tax=Adonisia turfae CCMR0081 TaxID=2292702 RepID=A0A6M0RN25_9CYAN|nr:hypothetical protein [Adonisia turfae CCMR0081]